MATSAGEVEVTLTLNQSDFNRMLGQTQSQLSDFGEGMSSSVVAIGAAAAAALAVVGTFLKGTVDAYAGYETSVTKLTALLNAQGNASQSTVTHLTALAQKLQGLTGVSDDEIIAAQGLLVSFGLQGKALDDATVAALDLTVRTGDLHTSAMLLGKAYEGNTTTLKRYGIEVSNHIDASRKFDAVMQQVQEHFGGSAQAMADTYTGKMNIMKNAFADLEKGIGKLIIGPLGEFLVKLTDLLNHFTAWVGILVDVHSQMGGLGNMLSGFVSTVLGPMLLTIYDFQFKITEILDKLPFMHGAVALLNLDIAEGRMKLTEQIAAWQKAMSAAKASAAAAAAGEEDVIASVADATKGVVDAAETQTKFVKDKLAEEMKARSDANSENKKAYQDFAKGFVITTADMWHEATSLADSFTTGVGAGFATMIMQGKSFGESMKTLFQDIATEIITWIVKMIIKMLIFLALREAAQSFGPVGVAVSSAMGLAQNAGLTGMASGGMISEPSIITGLHSGKQSLAGEAGPEAITPMSMAGGGGGGDGGITVNISGQFIEGDPSSWQKLINEKIVPAIRRFTMATPTGPFTRRRGVA